MGHLIGDGFGESVAPYDISVDFASFKSSHISCFQDSEEPSVGTNLTHAYPSHIPDHKEQSTGTRFTHPSVLYPRNSTQSLGIS